MDDDFPVFNPNMKKKKKSVKEHISCEKNVISTDQVVKQSVPNMKKRPVLKESVIVNEVSVCPANRDIVKQGLKIDQEDSEKFDDKKRRTVEEIMDGKNDEDDCIEFNPGMKKKKKRVVKEIMDDEDETAEIDFGALKKKKRPIKVSTEIEEEHTTDEYSYNMLLARAYSTMKKNHVTYNKEETIRIKVPPPSVGKIGPRKTIWLNFNATCAILKRNPDNVMKYVLSELGTTGNLNSNNEFIINERVQINRIEKIICSYISDYVICKNCKTYDTRIERRNKIDFLVCKACNSERSLVKIDPGFQALVAKRRTQKLET